MGARRHPQSPGDPLAIDPAADERTIASAHAVDTTGADPVTIVVPTGERTC